MTHSKIVKIKNCQYIPKVRHNIFKAYFSFSKKNANSDADFVIEHFQPFWEKIMHFSQKPPTLTRIRANYANFQKMVIFAFFT